MEGSVQGSTSHEEWPGETEERIAMLIRERDHAWAIVESFRRSSPHTEKLLEALRKISTQGIGRWDNDRKCMVDHNGEPWRHWARRAEEALIEFSIEPDVEASDV